MVSLHRRTRDVLTLKNVVSRLRTLYILFSFTQFFTFFQCQFCPKKFWGKSSLKEHTDGVHLNTKPHKCELCDFSSAYRNILREHVKDTHEQRKFSCPVSFYFCLKFIHETFKIYIPISQKQNCCLLGLLQKVQKHKISNLN